MALEGWSGWATLLILAGILIEISAVWDLLPAGLSDRIWSTLGNGLVGIGLAAEYIVIRRTIVASAALKRDAKLEVLEANLRAAKAKLELAEVNVRAVTADLSAAKVFRELAETRMKLGPRWLERGPLLEALGGIPKPDAPIRVLAQRGDIETFLLATQISDALGKDAGFPASAIPMTEAESDPTGDLCGGEFLSVAVLENLPNGDLASSVVGQALVAGLSKSISRVLLKHAADVSPGEIRIVVAQRLPLV